MQDVSTGYSPHQNRKKKKRVTDASTSSLAQMGPSQRGEVLLEHYDRLLALHSDSDTVHHYSGVIWKPVSDKDLAREMPNIFRESGVPYSMTAMKNTVDTMKLSLPVMGVTARNLIGFSNGVFDTRQGTFRPHDREDWLLVASEVEFGSQQDGETPESNAPAFWKWLTWATGGNSRKAERVLAALYMIMANRYAGDGAGIKAITGGDKVAIDPKHKPPYSTRIPAVILAVNNNAMTFSDRSGGISRRRVIFNFSQVVPENERDPLLSEKIEA